MDIKHKIYKTYILYYTNCINKHKFKGNVLILIKVNVLYY